MVRVRVRVRVRIRVRVVLDHSAKANNSWGCFGVSLKTGL